MVECQLPKLDVTGSSPVSRSIFNSLETPTRSATPITLSRSLGRKILPPLIARVMIRIASAGATSLVEKPRSGWDLP